MALTLMLSALSPLPEKFTYLPMGLMCSPNVPKHSTDVVVERTDAFQVGRLPVSGSITPAANRSISSQFEMGSSSSDMLGLTTIIPFAWSFKLDWDSMARTMASNNQVARIHKPDISRLNAMFYTQHEAPLTVTTTTESLVLRHLVSSIVNGIDYSDIYHQLTVFPEQAVVACFRSLPEETTVVIRQRLRTAATKEDDSVAVEALLRLENRLCGSTMRGDTEVAPMLDRLKTCKQPVALAIVRYASRASHSQELVLKQVLDVVRTLESTDINRLQVTELMRVLVEAGATLTHSCFFLHGLSAFQLQGLVDLGGGEILTWIQDGLLASAVIDGAKNKYRQDSNLVLNWILSSLKRSFSQKIFRGISTDDDANIAYPALVAAFNAALESSRESAVEAVYDTCQQLGYAAYCTSVNSYINSVVMQACINRDWTKAIRAVPKTTAAAISHQSTSIQHIDKNWDEYNEIFDEAMLAEDVQTVEELLDEDPEVYYWTRDSIDSECDGIAALAAIYDAPDGILTLLESRRVGAMSFLLCQYSHWTEVLQGPSEVSAFDSLEDFLYRREHHKDCRRFPCCLSLSRPLSHQIVLRALSYHAIHKSDTALMDWLHNHGLATTSIMVVRNEDFEVFQLWSNPGQNDKLLKPHSVEPYNISLLPLPSLLEVAMMQRQDPRILRPLLCRQLTYRDSDALLHAVKSKAQPSTIRLLLSAHPYEAAVSRIQYGSAALRIAIRDRNYELMRILAPMTDIHGLEQIDDEDGCLASLDPLGEAIMRKDRTAVKIVLENGGDPNTVVAFDGLLGFTPRSASNSVLLRMTPLLVAIDVGDYDMVSFLVNNGADINRDSGLGILRTPLQRASEIGDFEMVEYFISPKATVDSVPVYGGGTALQLAAMSGYLGIATLLIQNGANVNYPPARGPGRTAFEAAAEWCRPDMMHLLVQLGARLGMEVGEEVEERWERQGRANPKYYGVTLWRTEIKWRTQYERALQFAENRKEYASKAIVETIGMQLGIHIYDNFLEIAD
jgi:hypothetical protein